MEKKKTSLISSAQFITEAALDNPNLGWLEFVLADNQPNENKQGIKKEHFAALIETGLFMPLKMAVGEIAPGHAGATPLGAIASLLEEENKVLGKAALWKAERQADYEMLTSMSSNGESINISWEIAFTQSNVDPEGIEWLEDPRLTAATIVGNPAYAGRTPVLSVASGQPQESSEENSMELEERVKALEAEITTLKQEKTDFIKEKEAAVTEKEALDKELVELKEYKAEREKEAAEAATLAKRLKLFEEAGLKFTEEDITKHKATWIELTDEAFASMLSFVKEHKRADASDSSDIPDVSGDNANLAEKVRMSIRKSKEQS